MSSTTFDEIYAKIKEYDTIILHRHINPDPDAIDSQAGLGRSIRLASPEKRVLYAGIDWGDLTWIDKGDDIKDEDYKGTLVITTDTADRLRVSDQRYDMGDFLIKMNHHPSVDPYGDLYYVNDQAPAANEIIANFLISRKMPITAEVALSIYTGIVGDTGRFTYPETTTHTFEIAAMLAKTGIDLTQIARNISDVTFKQARLRSSVLDYMAVDKSGTAYAVLTQADLKKVGVTTEEASVTVSTPGRIKDILTWSVIIELEDGTYRVYYRSKGPVIDRLAAKRNDEGHALASGAKAKDEAEIKQIFAELIDVTDKYKEGHE